MTRPPRGRALEERFHSRFPSLMDAAVLSLVFRTRPVISCDPKIQMFSPLDSATQKMNQSKMHIGIFFNFFFNGTRIMKTAQVHVSVNERRHSMCPGDGTTSWEPLPSLSLHLSPRRPLLCNLE